VQSTTTDVLVIGGGLAGLVAALGAAREGRSVTLLCKSRAGHGGNTLVSGAGLSVMNPGNKVGDSPAVFEKDILESGKGICDQERVSLFVEKSMEVLPLLENFGVRLAKADGKLVPHLVPGHRVKRSYWAESGSFSYMNRGLSLMVPLWERAMKMGVRFIDRCTAIRIFVEENSVEGVLAVCNSTGEPIIFRTGAVVIAAGGGCSLYDHHNNTLDVGCDAFALAYEAGAVLRDMEFVQFYPTLMYRPCKVNIGSPLLGEGAVLRNALGEAFMGKYSASGDRATRDEMCQSIQNEIQSGRGTPEFVYMDCTRIPAEVLETRFADLGRKLKRAGLDITRDMLQVAPGAHFYIGGIAIDRNCRTNVDGLYACGEAAGGLHGANRLGRVALPEAVVFGQIAGQSASEAGRKRGTSKNRFTFTEADRPFSCFTGSVEGRELERELGASLWKNASVIKSEASLSQARSDIRRFEETLGKVDIRSKEDFLGFNRLRSKVTTARMLVEGSLLRKETRGSHCREDYPASKDQFLGNMFYWKNENGELDVVFRQKNGKTF